MLLVILLFFGCGDDEIEEPVNFVRVTCIPKIAEIHFDGIPRDVSVEFKTHHFKDGQLIEVSEPHPAEMVWVVDNTVITSCYGSPYPERTIYYTTVKWHSGEKEFKCGCVYLGDLFDD